MRLLLLIGLLALVTSARWLPQRWHIAITRHYTARGLTRAGLVASAGLAALAGGVVIALAAGLKRPGPDGDSKKS
jgi:hypothetical protein